MTSIWYVNAHVRFALEPRHQYFTDSPAFVRATEA